MNVEKMYFERITSSRRRERLANDSRRRGENLRAVIRLIAGPDADGSENLVVGDQNEDLGILLVIGPSATWHLLMSARARVVKLARSHAHSLARRRVGIILRVTYTSSTVTPRPTIFKNARPIATGENRLRTRCRSASVLS